MTKESDILVAIQDQLYREPYIQVARGMSLFGEHAAGWLGMGVVGMAVDKRRRRKWAALTASAFASHAASVVIKRVVRRPRPTDARLTIGVGTPSQLSFPSSHSTSTTAALTSLALLTRSPLPLVGVPAMMLSRMVLGVHYPTDVAAGAILGASTALLADKLEKRNA